LINSTANNNLNFLWPIASSSSTAPTLFKLMTSQLLFVAVADAVPRRRGASAGAIEMDPSIHPSINSTNTNHINPPHHIPSSSLTTWAFFKLVMHRLLLVADAVPRRRGASAGSIETDPYINQFSQ